jgi:PAS domain S-box-containing protein
MISLLYVDDEPALLELVKNVLEDSAEFSVDTKSSAQDALTALSSCQYDAIVADYFMPEIDGIAFLQQVRKQYGDIPFILLTGRGKEEIVIKALNSGADFYLQKGGDFQIVFTQLKHILKQCIGIRRTKKNLIEQEERYHDLQNANDLIQSVAPEGHFLFVNKKWLDTLGYKEEDLERISIFDIIHQESLDHCMTTFQKVISGENLGIIDAVFKTRDGDKVYVEGIANCRMRDGKPQYTRGIFKDVTDRKLAEAALRDSEARFRTMIDSIANLAIQGYGPDGTIHYWNKANESMYGYTREEAMGKNLIDLIIPLDMRDFVREAIRHGAETGEMPPASELNLMHKDGSLVPVFSSHARIQIHGHEPEMFCLDVDFSELKKMEREIRESEERFRALVETTRDMIWEVDSDDRYTYISPQVQEILGYAPEELIGKTCFDLMLPEETKNIRKQFAEIVSAGKPIVRLENINLHKDGRIVILETSGEPVHAANGTIVGYRGIDRDITERKKAEDAMRQSENYLKTLLESIPAGVVVVDARTHTILRVNPSALELIGAPGDYVLGKVCHHFICPAVEGNCPISDKGMHMDRSERVLLNASGSPIPIIKSVSRANLNGQEVLIETFVDISDRKKAEESLRESEEKFRSLVEHALDGILILDFQGTILFANHAAAQTIELDDCTCLHGRNVMEFIAPESREDVIHDFLQVSQGHDAYLAHYNGISAKGNKICIESIGKVISYEGKPADLVSIRDITERKLAREALKQVNRKLNLLSSITRHDIKNQLLSLSGYLEISKSSLGDPARTAEFIAKEEKIADAIAFQISFTKDYEDMGVKSPEWQNINSIIKKVTARLPIRDISVDAGDLNREIFADPLLEKVFYNLIDNALRYGGDRMKTIRISSQESDGHLTVICEDDGEGIAAEDKKRLFTRGFGKHTGLGLFLSREILSITGITISENGTPGNGARFEIVVPNGSFRFPA